MNNRYLQRIRLFAILLFGLAGLFLLLAALGATSATPLVLAAFALLWAVWGALLLWISRRTEAYMRERGDDFDFEMKLNLKRKKKAQPSEEEA